MPISRKNHEKQYILNFRLSCERKIIVLSAKDPRQKLFKDVK